MFNFRKLLSYALVALGTAISVSFLSAKGPADLDPAALTYKLPDQIKWTDSAGGSSSAVLYGDPTKPGLYIMLNKWYAHHNSRPHFHPNDRFITVLSGTWWVNTGSKYDPDNMVPMPAGSFVTHFGKQIHYDGAKDVDAVLEIVGEGPATATPAEQKVAANAARLLRRVRSFWPIATVPRYTCITRHSRRHRRLRREGGDPVRYDLR